MVKRDRAGAAGDLRDIRVGSSDGTPFGKGTMAELVGGIAATFAAKDSGGRGQGGGKGYGGKPAGQPKGERLSKMLRSFLKRMGMAILGSQETSAIIMKNQK